MRRRVSFAKTLVLWTVVGTSATSLACVASAYIFGWRALTVMSGSMEPAVATGDVVVSRPMPAAEALAGQVITFSYPEGEGKLLTHRVKTVSVRNGTARFVTQGDANSGVERWSIPADDSIGVVEHQVPKIGYLAVGAGSWPGTLALLIPLIVIAALELLSLWRPRAVAESKS